MGVSGMTDREPVRLNDLDWELLKHMSDGQRYTQKYLADDVGRFDDESYDWIRQRAVHLHDHGLIQRVGSSKMYQISDLGRAALELEGEYSDELTPREFGDRVRNLAQELESADNSDS